MGKGRVKMYNYLVQCVTADPNYTWDIVGRSREEVEGFYSEGLRDGKFQKPVYRIVARRKYHFAVADAVA
jgi:hypothetical protein